jgi:hypothetical protein
MENIYIWVTEIKAELISYIIIILKFWNSEVSLTEVASLNRNFVLSWHYTVAPLLSGMNLYATL